MVINFIVSLTNYITNFKNYNSENLCFYYLIKITAQIYTYFL